MILVGLTGSVGTGKTEVSKIFLRKNIPVFESDRQVGIILQKEKVKKNIKRHFPEAFEKETLVKKNLANIVFRDDKKLKTLENIIYKNLRDMQAKWIRLQITKRKKIAIFDVPLLFEKDNVFKYDFILVTTCSYSIQKVRVLKRKDWDYDRFTLTLKKQIRENIKKKKANMIIHSDRGKRYAFNKVIKFLALVEIKKRSTKEILRYFS